MVGLDMTKIALETETDDFDGLIDGWINSRPMSVREHTILLKRETEERLYILSLKLRRLK